MQAFRVLGRAHRFAPSHTRKQHGPARITGGNVQDTQEPFQVLDGSSPAGCSASASHGIRLSGDLEDDEAEDQNGEQDAPPAWLRAVAIAVTTGTVAVLELFICKRPPFFWAPVTALLAVMFWRTGLRDATRSNAPPRAPDRFFMLAFFLLVVMLEITVLKQLVYAPWLSALVFMIVSPSNRAMDDRESILTREARERTMRESSNRVPVTPRESSAWVGRLLSCYWVPYVEPLLLRQTILPLQEQLESIAPAGWTLTLDSFSVGDVSPTLTGWQVFNNPRTGEVEAVTADLEFESTTFSMNIAGTGPFVGSFTGSLKGLSMSGKLQFVPVKDARVLLFSFTERPELDIKLGIRGPFIGRQAIPQFSFLKNAITTSLEKDFVEPNRGMIPLEFEEMYGRPLASIIKVKVVRVHGLSAYDQGKASTGGKVSKMEQISDDGILIEVDGGKPEEEARERNDNGTRAGRGKRATAVRVTVGLPEVKLFRETGQHDIGRGGEAAINANVQLQMISDSAAVNVRVCDENNRTLGTASIKAAHLPDGATAFWGTGTDGRALAVRWTQGMSAWRGSIPIVGTKHAAVELELSMTPWQYSLDVATPQTFRSTVRSVVAIQVLEGRHLAAKDFGGTSDPYVLCRYGRRTATTRPVFTCLDPVYGEILIFQESRSVLSRRLRLEVYDKDVVTSDDSCGFATVNLDLLAQGQVQEQWCQLRGETRGELRVRLLVLPGDVDDVKVREAAEVQLASSETIYSTDILEVTIVGAEGVPTTQRKKLLSVVMECNGVAIATTRRKASSTQQPIWEETLRIRAAVAANHPIKISLKQASENEVAIKGRTLGSAVVSPEFAFTELAALRAAGAAVDTAPQRKAKRRVTVPSDKVSPSRLMYGDLSKSGTGAKASGGKQSVKVDKATVAELEDGTKGKVQKTSVLEQWLDLPGSGRILVRIQGSLGTNAQLSSDFMGGIVNSLAASTRLPNIFDEPEEAAAVDPKKAPDFNLFEWARKQSDAIAKKLFD